MTFDVTRDGFLDNRITVQQPRHGFRAGHDSVLLAAAVPAGAGDSVLELGAGAGVASLCLAARVPECRILGIEQDPDLVALANANASANGMAERVRFVVGDVRTFDTQSASFDHVFFNPPFHPASGQTSPSRARDRAMRDSENALSDWIGIAAALTRPGGSVTAILRADRLTELDAIPMGRRETLLLLARAGEAPKRAILRLFPGTGPGRVDVPPVALHEADGRPTQAAEAVLRRGEALPFT